MIFSYNGMDVYYEQKGQGKSNVLLLHGWGGSTDSWIPVTKALSSNAVVTTLDFPGHGKSQMVPEAWNVDQFMEMTSAFIEHLKIEGCDIVAHSFGGRVSLLLASSHPQLINKMVLTGCAGLKPNRNANYYIRTYTYKILKAIYQSPIVHTMIGKERTEHLRKKLQSKFGSKDYNDLDEKMRATFVKVVNQDLRHCLKKIDASTLLIWGENDTATPLWMGQIMEKEIKDAGLVVFKDVGHFAYLDKCADFIKIVKTFLKL